MWAREGELGCCCCCCRCCLPMPTCLPSLRAGRAGLAFVPSHGYMQTAFCLECEGWNVRAAWNVRGAHKREAAACPPRGPRLPIAKLSVAHRVVWLSQFLGGSVNARCPSLSQLVSTPYQPGCSWIVDVDFGCTLGAAGVQSMCVPPLRMWGGCGVGRRQ